MAAMRTPPRPNKGFISIGSAKSSPIKKKLIGRLVLEKYHAPAECRMREGEVGFRSADTIKFYFKKCFG
jgi:hypothetical protein